MSFGVKLPLRYSSVNGFVTLDNFRNTIKQNFKMLLLTDPGERVMIPEYGVGVKTYLFENYGNQMETKLRKKILEQVSIYLPIINITDILVDSSKIEQNTVSMMIYYSIPDIGIQDLLEFTI